MPTNNMMNTDTFSPSNIILKRVGPKIWLPVILTLVGLILVCSGLQNNYAGWISFRIILGLVEAGMFPGCSYALTAWYSPREIHSRMSIFYSGASLAGAFSSLLAYGIGQLDHTWGYRGWRFIYVIEGVFTFCVGLASFFFIYPSPAQVGSWLSPEERQFLLLRHRYAAGGETGVAEKEGFSMRYAKQSFRSFHVYAITTMELTLCVVVYGISFILPTIIANLGYSAARAQALTAPPYVFACLVTVMFGYASDRFQQRMIFVLLPNLMAAVGCAIIMASVRYPHIEGVTMFGCFLMAGGLYPIPPAVTAWISINTAGSMKRSVSMALMISIGQLGGVSSSLTLSLGELLLTGVDYGLEHLHCQPSTAVSGWIWNLSGPAGSVWDCVAGRVLFHFEENQRSTRRNSDRGDSGQVYGGATGGYGRRKPDVSICDLVFVLHQFISPQLSRSHSTPCYNVTSSFLCT